VEIVINVEIILTIQGVMCIKKFIKLFKVVVMDVLIAFIGMMNNYLIPKTYQVNSINHLEVYFINSLGERLCIFDKMG
jgi:membrane protein DedA with SNARE-associated domain